MIRFHCIGFHDRRSPDLKARGDVIERQRLGKASEAAQAILDEELLRAWKYRVAENERRRFARKVDAARGLALLKRQAS